MKHHESQDAKDGQTQVPYSSESRRFYHLILFFFHDRFAILLITLTRRLNGDVVTKDVIYFDLVLLLSLVNIMLAAMAMNDESPLKNSQVN
jgi:hypothetical protein